MRASTWYREQEASGFPALKRGAVFVSMYHGSSISNLIAAFQGKGQVAWSHTGIYIGNGQIAEATYPKGGVRSLKPYLRGGYTFEIYNVNGWTPAERAFIASEAARIAPGNYDTTKFIRHVIDNAFERATWNAERGRGFRPLAALFKLDRDKDRCNICSELVERAIEYGTGERICAGELGNARPYDVWKWLVEVKKARPAFRHERGDVAVGPLFGIEG
jgi:hypothetical protein